MVIPLLNGYTEEMKKSNFLIVLISLTIFWTNIGTVYAKEQTLPSGISAWELKETINQYVEDNEKTTAGMAYAVFNREGELASGYYGYADKENNIKVDKDTVFEWGSASKLMVWVSVMQLVEQEKISLEADIQEYLPSDVLKNLNYDADITMLHLMNHSAGFQEDYTDLFIKDVDAYSNLEEAILEHQPEQIFEPGTVVAYSNWSTALAAYVVEQVSGMDYVEYVHANIFEPLRMEHSAIAMDLSDNEWVAEKRKELMSYDITGNELEDAFYYISLYPVGMCTSTLEDFETFAKGLIDENTVLFSDSDTWKEMFTPTDYYYGTEIGRNYHGMWMIPLGVQTIGHGGNTAGCSSYLLMNLESGIGTVVMTNQANETVYNIDMMKLIYGEYTDEKYEIDKGNPQGIYKTARTFKVGPLKLLNLSYQGDLNEEDVFFVYSVGNPLSKIEYPYVDYYEITPSEMFVELAMLGVFILTFIISLIIIVVRGIREIVKKLKKTPKEKGVPYVYFAFATELLILIFLTYGYISIINYELAVTYQWAFAVVGILTVILCLLSVLGCYKTFTIKERKKGYKVVNVLLIINSFSMVVNICYWNLFKFWAL